MLRDRAPSEAAAHDEVARRVASYRPRAIESASWSAVRPFVLECAARLPLGGWASTVRILGTLARLATWAEGEGLPLDPETVLGPDTVERFVEVGLSDDQSSATYRSVLRHIGPLLTVRAPWEPRPASVARPQVARPYSPFEVEQLRIDALKQPPEARQRAARAFLTLGLGAGLDGRWVTRVKGRDVSRRGDVVVVAVGEPSARTVPVLGMWEDEVLELPRPQKTHSSSGVTRLLRIEPVRWRRLWWFHPVIHVSRSAAAIDLADLASRTPAPAFLSWLPPPVCRASPCSRHVHEKAPRVFMKVLCWRWR